MISASSTPLPRDFMALEQPEAEGDLDLKTRVVEDAAEFAAMRVEWNELLESSTSDCVFLTWEWLHTWWTHVGGGKRLFIVTVRSASQLVGIAPLTMTRAWVGPVRVPVLEFAGTGTIGSDYLDFIVRDTCSTAALNALTSFLASTGISMRLPRVKQAFANAKSIGRSLADHGWETVEVPTEVCPFIDLSAGSWNSYLSSLGPRHRYNFKRRLRNLTKSFDLRIEYADAEDERREALSHVVNLHLRRWQPRGGSDAFHTQDVLAFHEQFSALARERGWLRLLVLTLNGEPAAAFYGFRYRKTFHFYQSGFNPAFLRYSVGLVMIGLTIRDAIEEGATEYDLLHGNETYKFLWATQVRRLVRVELYPPGAMGRLHHKTVRVTASARKFVKRLLRREAPSDVPTILS